MLQKTDRVDIKSSNNVAKIKDQTYSNFVSTLVEEQLKEDTEHTIFGARLDTDAMSIDDLFTFDRSGAQMDLEGGFQSHEKTSDLMKAFVHQGEYFSKDPFSFNPSIPETYKPFEFNFAS